MRILYPRDDLDVVGLGFDDRKQITDGSVGVGELAVDFAPDRGEAVNLGLLGFEVRRGLSRLRAIVSRLACAV